MDEDPIEGHLEKAKKTSADGKAYGYSRFFDIIKKEYDWKRCELVEYNKIDKL